MLVNIPYMEHLRYDPAIWFQAFGSVFCPLILRFEFPTGPSDRTDLFFSDDGRIQSRELSYQSGSRGEIQTKTAAFHIAHIFS